MVRASVCFFTRPNLILRMINIFSVSIMQTHEMKRLIIENASSNFYINWTTAFITPPRNRGGVIFSLQFIYVCVCVCVCLCVCESVCPDFLWTKFQPNLWTDLDAIFAKWLLTALAQTLLKLVTFGQRSRSHWRDTHFFFLILC